MSLVSCSFCLLSSAWCLVYLMPSEKCVQLSIVCPFLTASICLVSCLVFSDKWQLSLVLCACISSLYYLFSKHSSNEDPPEPPSLPLRPIRRRRPSDPWEVLEEEVHIQAFLGVGAFGEVWRAVVQHVGQIRGNREVAVKKLRGIKFFLPRLHLPVWKYIYINYVIARDLILSWHYRQFPSCISPLFQSESYCEAFHMEISFINMQTLVHLHLNKTNFHMKDFALGLALKQRWKATRKSPITTIRAAQLISISFWLNWRNFNEQIFLQWVLSSFSVNVFACFM